MSFHLPPQAGFDGKEDEETASISSESESDDDDQNWDDWTSDVLIRAPCQSLFDEKKLPSVEEALAYDNSTHGFDLNATCSRLSLDYHGRIRLINYIRKMKPSPRDLSVMSGDDPLLKADEYLLPTLEDDPLLQVQSDNWSDSDDDNSNPTDPLRRIQILEKKLTQAKQDFADYWALVSQKMNIADLHDVPVEPGPSQVTPPVPDDDTHYFKSYGENDIHAVMIQDKVRTSTYAHFILTNPALFSDAIVLDVGCGTGILSLFAARSGAKRVIAVDASDIAEKAERIAEANDFKDIITVIRGKVEEITLPDDIKEVDIIISEWMGYALLYESMLNSVLRARDRFLRPNGVMVPSQCRMMLGLCDATDIHKDRIGFWSDVYGFDLSAMAEDVYNDAIVDVVGPDAMLSAPYTIKDLALGEVTPRELDFSSSFTLISTAERRKKAYAFILYFDTFFTTSGHPVSSSIDAKLIKEGDVVLAELWPVGGKPAPQRRRSQSVDKNSIISFSTGPKSVPTHWKQTLFLLREPIDVTEGSIIFGSFHCRKSEDNSRELRVEIHYSVKQDSEAVASDTIVQIFNVR